MATNAAVAVESSSESLSPACRAGSLFVDYLNVRDFEAIGRLFADPTDVTGPDGGKYHHPSDVVDFEKRGFAAMTTHWTFKASFIAPAGKNACLLEFALSDRDGAPFEPGAVDHFEVNGEGKIVKFIPYFASSRVVKTTDLIKHTEPAKKP
jgi:hypothetical protein